MSVSGWLRLEYTAQRCTLNGPVRADIEDVLVWANMSQVTKTVYLCTNITNCAYLQALAFADPRVGLKVPTWHCLHWLSLVCPSLSKYVPAGHAVHCDPLVEAKY